MVASYPGVPTARVPLLALAMSWSFDRCRIMASAVTLLRNAVANSAATGLAVDCSELADRWKQPVGNAVTAITASTAGIVVNLFPIGARLDRCPGAPAQDTAISDMQSGERREGEVAHHEPRQNERHRHRRRPTVGLPTPNPPAHPASIGPGEVRPDQQHDSRQAKSVEPGGRRDVAVHKGIQHPQAAASWTVDAQ